MVLRLGLKEGKLLLRYVEWGDWGWAVDMDLLLLVVLASYARFLCSLHSLTILASLTTGLFPPPHPPRRLHLDTREHSLRRKGAEHPAREGEQDGMVGARRDVGAADRRQQDFARRQQAQ
jgi:hypothetical protein